METNIDQVVIRTKERLLAVVKQAIADTIEEAQTPVAKGGRMRVKTGFLRASGVAALNAAPQGPGRGDPKAPDNSYTWAGEAVNKVLAELKIGDAFYFGWTARYAKYREVYDGFLETALQNWQSNIDRAVAIFKDKDGVR